MVFHESDPIASASSQADIVNTPCPYCNPVLREYDLDTKHVQARHHACPGHCSSHWSSCCVPYVALLRGNNGAHEWYVDGYGGISNALCYRPIGPFLENLNSITRLFGLAILEAITIRRYSSLSHGRFDR